MRNRFAEGFSEHEALKFVFNALSHDAELDGLEGFDKHSLFHEIQESIKELQSGIVDLDT